MFKAPDIKGPRFRKPAKRLITKDLYNRFIERHPQHAGVDFEKFKEVIENSLKKMANVVISERDGIELPIGGTVFLGSTKIRKKHNYDIQASIKANAPIKHRNYETDGFVAKIYFSPRMSKTPIKKRNIWTFKGHRDMKRAISEVYPRDWKKYIVVAALYDVRKEYKKASVRNFRVNDTNRKVQFYNEFDQN